MFDIFKEYKSKKPSFINRYTIAVFIFIVWMAFFDRFNVFSQHYLTHSVENLEQEKEYYRAEYEATLKLKKEIDKDLETFARERYFLHRADEEVFIIK